MSDTTEATEVGEWRRVNPLSIIVGTFKIAAQAIVPIAFAIYGIANDGGATGIAAAIFGFGGIAFLGVVGGLSWLGWYRLQYRIGDNDIRLEQGIISRSARSVPYDRIQDVSLEQKLIPRLLGLVEVKFETGAGGKDELKLSFVSELEGERLRETVRALVEGAEGEARPAAPAATGDAVASATVNAATVPSRLLFEMPPRRLFTFGLFSFSLVIFAVILGAAQQLEFLLPINIWDYVERYFESQRYAEAGSYISGMDMAARIAGIAYLVISVIVVGLLSGIVKTFIRDWDFRLERTAKGFRRRRGLFTKTDVVMPVHRVQALVVSTGWIRRRFGWHGLSFISLAQDSGKANHEVAPFAKMVEIAPIAEEAGFELPDEAENWRRSSANYYFDRAVITSLVVAIVGITAFTAASMAAGRFVPGLAVIATAVPVVIAIVVAREYFLWRHDRHALDPRQVLSRRGWLAPRTKIANRVKLHSVEIAQGPLARWRGYCDLKFGMAGGRFSFDGLDLEDARKLRAAVLDSIASVDFARLPR